ncbi:MAG: phosphatase PAP2 family protein [Thaumarchaeota archaeon]|nr:phosphatase PAP2 family protein [Nitrososphaerota archaeon]
MMKYVVPSAVLLALFGILAVLISHNNSQVVSFDNSALSGVNPVGGALDHIMVLLSKFGREFIWIPVVAVLFVFGKKDGRKTAVFLTIAFLILIPLGSVIKSEIDRQRPTVPDDRLLIKNEHDASFPSGHAVMVSAGATILLLTFNRSRQIVFSIILGIEAMLVAFSRVYVGVHYPMDVIGGILLGCGVSLAVIASGRYMEPIFTKVNGKP